MDNIVFDNESQIWIYRHDNQNIKSSLIDLCSAIVKAHPNSKTDSYQYRTEYTPYVENDLDKIINISLDKCIELYNGNPQKINLRTWINVVKSQNPIQYNFKTNPKENLHIHSKMNEKVGLFIPNYTFVYYVQMPNNLENEDGVLYIGGQNGKIHTYLPKEGDILIMPGNLPHAPSSAFKSTKDRVVIAGNVGFDNLKTLL